MIYLFIIIEKLFTSFFSIKYQNPNDRSILKIMLSMDWFFDIKKINNSKTKFLFYKNNNSYGVFSRKNH
jgi:hypothetical protein